jgi:sugar phosphate isomerase/epimerase
MKFSLFTVSVPDLTPEQALEKLQEYGYDAVDWRVTDLPTDSEIQREAPSYWRNNYCTIDISDVDQKAEEIRAMTEKYGLRVNALATYITCVDSEEKIRCCMVAAKRMGCSRIRVNSLKYTGERSYQEVYQETVEGFKRVEKLAIETGVRADLEMHMGTITPSASAAYQVVSNFNSEYIGVIYDTGNVIYEGFEVYKMAFEILGPYLDLVHVKNAKWVKKEVDGQEKYVPDWAPFADGYADFKSCFQALKAVGYDGYITFEDFSFTESSEEKLKNNIQYIKNLIDSLE